MLIHVNRSINASQLEAKILTATHGRIRDLKVEDVRGFITVRGNVPSYHIKQLALQAMFECLSANRFLALITVRKPSTDLGSSDGFVQTA